ncbi:methyl-accepting chemotaxis protein [Roseateles terrae]|uniref:Methyl-accepting chemotaxis protein n=1 Tax=Roseateles terrae TaxID=431060 RepID=A0ABR6GL42_9BURK|nr:methyl-accepting chemotaxis protein [Roseateles terrae]MBB3192818.1 methyl-accepting chemotaxis protein [Roseateles terrae]OWQ89914.1 methyl-accepting chemotaxis protein [Roseateles terrae]
MKTLTVGQRLAMGFGLTIAVGIASVSFAVVKLNALSADIDQLASNRMVKVAQFSELKDNLQSIGRFVRNCVINTDPTFVEGEKKKIGDLRLKNQELLEKLEKTITLPRGKELLKSIVEQRPAYNKALDDTMALAINGDKAAAGAFLVGQVRSLQTPLFVAVDQSKALQQEIADGLARNANETARSSAMIMFALALVMTVFGGAVGLSLSRNLRRALGAEPEALSHAVARVAGGDLTLPLCPAASDSTSVLANVARMQSNLSDVVAGVRANSESVATASAQIAQGNQDLSQRTEEQASALQQTAATMEQLNTTVRNNADNAQQANQLAQAATTIATSGGEVVGKVVATMQGISESSRKIGDIIGVIDGIAFQTNILALNAAVEAARAGEQGRGFAVVASEVRTLARRSADAAKEIKTLIHHSVSQVEQGTTLVDHAGATMGQIVESIRRVNDIVAEISSASQEQSSGISQVGEAVSQMDKVTQQNAALVEESAAAAESLKVQAEQLVGNVAVFKLPSAAMA